MSFWLDIDVSSEKRDENNVQRSFPGEKFPNPVDILPSLALFFKKMEFLWKNQKSGTDILFISYWSSDIWSIFYNFPALSQKNSYFTKPG